MSGHTYVTKTTDAAFDRDVLEGEGPVLVDFGAAWCGPCRMLAPVVEALAAEYAGRLRVVAISIDDNPEVAGRYGVLGIPLLIFFMHGREIERVAGAPPKAKIAGAIERVLGTAARS